MTTKRFTLAQVLSITTGRHADAWLSLDPIQEAEDMVGPERVIAINTGDSK